MQRRTGQAWIKNDLDGALAKAKAENKRVFVAFTGYACTNCHWMKANMFPRPEIAGALSNFILVELYTDGTDTESDKNQKLQESTFQTVAIPFYAIFEGDRGPVAKFASLTRQYRANSSHFFARNENSNRFDPRERFAARAERYSRFFGGAGPSRARARS